MKRFAIAISERYNDEFVLSDTKTGKEYRLIKMVCEDTSTNYHTGEHDTYTRNMIDLDDLIDILNDLYDYPRLNI